MTGQVVSTSIFQACFLQDSNHDSELSLHADYAFFKPRSYSLLGGKLLSDKMRISDCNIPPGHVIQCVVNDMPVQFDVIRTTGTIVGKE